MFKNVFTAILVSAMIASLTVSDGMVVNGADLQSTGSSSADIEVVARPVLNSEIAASTDVPVISNVDVDPYAFNPEDGEETTITFEIDEGANVDVWVNDPSDPLTVITRSFSDFNGDFYDENDDLELEWDGEDDHGDIVDEGIYNIVIKADNSAGYSQATITVRVDGDNNNDEEDIIKNLTVDPSNNWDPRDDDDLEIEFDLTQDVDNLRIEAKKGSKTVEIYDRDNVDEDDNIVKRWDGRDEDNDYVSDGDWTIRVIAEDGNDEDTDTKIVEVDSDGSGDDDDDDDDSIIKNLKINPSNEWDPKDDDDLKIEFDLTQDVDNLRVEAKKGSKTVKIYDRDDIDEDDNIVKKWDGKDDDNDYVSEGEWTIRVIAEDGNDEDTDTKKIDIDYDGNGSGSSDAKIVKAFVTKTSFDPREGEFVYLVFRLDDDAKVDIDLYDGSSREFKLKDNMKVNDDTWYAVKWDGKDDDNDYVDEDDDWKFKLTALDDDNDTTDSEYINVDVEEDELSSSYANITKDYVKPVIFDRDNNGDITFNYCIDDDAEVTINVYKGESASGSVVAEIMDNKDEDEGCNTKKWDGEDDDGDELAKNTVYSYKITSESDDDGKTTTEIGRFVVAEDNGSGDDDDDDDDDDYDCDAGNYRDLRNVDDEELCEAIDWVTDRGIFSGYPDNSFKPYMPINRAEVLKVTLEAFDANLIYSNGGKLGFKDVDPNAWYMKYLRTAQFYGMFDGYPDKTARLDQIINRAELLKFVLEASDELTGAELPEDLEDDFEDVDYTQWYADYVGAAYTYGLFDEHEDDNDEAKRYLHPDRPVYRGEVALMFYRLYEAGLMN